MTRWKNEVDGGRSKVLLAEEDVFLELMTIQAF